MATPSKAVQFKDVDSVVEMYQNMQIPACGIKQNSALNFRYNGENLEDGAAQLMGFLQKLYDCESSAIYTLCLYEDPPAKINEKTTVDLSWNFRLRDHVAGFVPGEQYGGMTGQLLAELKAMRKELDGIKNQPPEEHKLGMIGEIMEMDAFQPLLMAIGHKVADWVVGAPTNELKRVSGVPGVESQKMHWLDDPLINESMDRLSKSVEDLSDLLQRLADLAENHPMKFKLYRGMFNKMK